jgi:hypothetical protein
MTPARKMPVKFQATQDYRRELALLYARKSALDSLIASLEVYDRYRAPAPASRERKTA